MDNHITRAWHETHFALHYFVSGTLKSNEIFSIKARPRHCNRRQRSPVTEEFSNFLGRRAAKEAMSQETGQARAQHFG
jgi:hypothetical protein